jgi:hypothetical protein
MKFLDSFFAIVATIFMGVMALIPLSILTFKAAMFFLSNSNGENMTIILLADACIFSVGSVYAARYARKILKD